jgi:hypothetical protein
LCCQSICETRSSCCTDAWTAECVALLHHCGDLQIVTPGCVGDGSCVEFGTPGACFAAGCAPGGPIFQCEGDADGDGIDDMCGCVPPAPQPIPPTMTAGKSAADPDRIEIAYDVITCNASQHMLVFGVGGNFSQVVLADCLIGSSGTYTAQPPAGDVWFLVAGREGSRYSSMGQATAGERVLVGVEEACAADLTADVSAGCP